MTDPRVGRREGGGRWQREGKAEKGRGRINVEEKNGELDNSLHNHTSARRVIVTRVAVPRFLLNYRANSVTVDKSFNLSSLEIPCPYHHGFHEKGYTARRKARIFISDEQPTTTCWERGTLLDMSRP